MNVVNSFGLSPSQLHEVFPHHVVIGPDLRIKQVGQGARSILKNFSHLENNHSSTSLIGEKAEDVFSISVPDKCKWNWDDIMLHERAVFEVELVNTSLLRCNGLKRLPLKGGVVVTTTHSDSSNSSMMEYTATFLFSLSFTELDQLRDCGFSASDVSRYTFQGDVFAISKSLSSDDNTMRF